MSEFQRYEFMTVDRSLTAAQRAAVNRLSSHIEVSPTQAVVEYEWGDFKHDPIKVLHDYFDGFLYWANWGAPRLALRFPHGLAPFDLFETYINQYDLDEVVTLSRATDYDILDAHFGDLEGPEEWVDYELEPILAIRDELLNGNLRAFYIVWLAAQRLYAEAKDSSAASAPPIPPNFGALSGACRAFARLLQVPDDLLAAAGRHSARAPEPETPEDDLAEQLKLLAPERASDYLLRLARNESGLNRQLIQELRELTMVNKGTIPLSDAPVLLSSGERIPYTSLYAESVAIGIVRDRDWQTLVRENRERHLQEVHDNPEEYWRQADAAAKRGSGTGYDEATQILLEIREAFETYHNIPAFTERFYAWLPAHRMRRALMQRLREQRFPIPEE